VNENEKGEGSEKNESGVYLSDDVVDDDVVDDDVVDDDVVDDR